MTEAIAESLEQKTHKKLTYAFRKPKIETWRKYIDQKPMLEKPGELFERLEKCFEEARKNGLEKTLNNGLTCEENLVLFKTGDLKTISYYIEKGLKKCHP